MAAVRSRQELFERAKMLWPVEFRIRDDQQDLPALTDPSRAHVYNAIEDSLEAEDELFQIAAWALNQAICTLINDAFEASRFVVLTADVTLESFDCWMKLNLDETCSEHERLFYEALPVLNQSVV